MRQSSVSRGVRELEDHLGAALFQRSAGGVVLTPIGQQFLKDAEAALDHLALATHLAGAVGRDERHVLRIGAVPIPGSGFLPEALHSVAVSSPGCRLALHEASSADNLAGVRFGALDLAIVFGTGRIAAGVEAVPLWRERLLCAVPESATARASSLTWTDVGPNGLILPAGELRNAIIARLAQVFGEAFVGAVCRAGPETALRLAAAGQGRAIVTAAGAGPAIGGLALSPIADEGMLVSAVRLLRNEKLPLRRLMAVLKRMAAAYQERGCDVTACGRQDSGRGGAG